MKTMTPTEKIEKAMSDMENCIRKDERGKTILLVISTLLAGTSKEYQNYIVNEYF